ncbi:MAG: outer membrane beta-barrel protein [Woeseiaceae bacterium]|nr:outer membrane beta-barrel protein [Woeseiaceae bacterium]
MSRFSVIAAVLVCLASPAWAQQDQSSFELTPIVGYRFGGTLEIEDSPESFDIDDSATFGVILNFPHRADTRWEVLYSRQSTEADFSDPASVNELIDIDTHVLQIGGTYQFESETPRVQPYLAATIGGTYVEASANGSESDAFWSGSLGLGMLVAPTARVGLRLEARGYFTFTNSSTDLLCVSGPEGAGCAIRATGDIVSQFEAFAGVVVRF